MKCWYETIIDVSKAMNPNWQYPPMTAKFGIWNYAPRDMFNDTWLEYAENIGITVINVILFYRRPYLIDDKAHIDIEPGDSTKHCVFGLNWAIGGKNSEMIWYEPPNFDADILWSPAKLPYQAWPVNKLVPIEKKCIQSTPTLVRTDIPHSVNVRDELRLCFSLRLPNKISCWDKAVEWFSDKGLLVS